MSRRDQSDVGDKRLRLCAPSQLVCLKHRSCRSIRVEHFTMSKSLFSHLEWSQNVEGEVVGTSKGRSRGLEIHSRSLASEVPLIRSRDDMNRAFDRILKDCCCLILGRCRLTRYLQIEIASVETATMAAVVYPVPAVSIRELVKARNARYLRNQPVLRLFIRTKTFN